MNLRIKKDIGVKSKYKPRNFNKKYIFVFEGEKTEKQYFTELKNIKHELNINDLIYIELLDKDDETISNQLSIVKSLDNYIKETLSLKKSPETLISFLEKYIDENIIDNKDLILDKLHKSFVSSNNIQNVDNFINSINNISFENETIHDLNSEIDNLKKRLDYESDIDEICIIIDRDKNSFKEFQYDIVLDICKNNNYTLGVSNPCFEFWLLLHLTDATEYDPEKIKSNKKISKSRNSKKYVESKIAEQLNGSYNKSNLNFNNFKDKISTAINNQKLYHSDIDSLKNNIGTNIGDIISRLRNNDDVC